MVWFIVVILIIGVTSGSEKTKWLSPFNEFDKKSLCTAENRNWMFTRLTNKTKRTHKLYFWLQTDSVCWDDYKKFMDIHNAAKDGPLIQFLNGLDFCYIRLELRRKGYDKIHALQFQLKFARAAFALICNQTRYLYGSKNTVARQYSQMFRVLYEKDNPDRRRICDKLIMLYAEVFQRCQVLDTTARKNRLKIVEKYCTGQHRNGIINTLTLFRRFAFSCNSIPNFFAKNVEKNLSEALIDDVAFMNTLRGRLENSMNAESKLPQLTIETRLALQHYGITALKLKKQLTPYLDHLRCSRKNANSQLVGFYRHAEHSEGSANVTAPATSSPNEDSAFVEVGPSEDSNDSEETAEDTDADEFSDDDILEQQHCQQLQNAVEYRAVFEWSQIGVSIKYILTFLIALITMALTLLLLKTWKHLSTATVLFVFNILFSNLLFIMSFLCLFADLFVEEKYKKVVEKVLMWGPEPALAIAESMNTHLFAKNQFVKHLLQESLYSLAQNGSLLGLINLLVLVLVVIRRSMIGKPIHLSKRCVVTVFGLFWLVLFTSHIAFSLLQLSAITNIDEIFQWIEDTDIWTCQSLENPISTYEDIGSKCDDVAPFYTFGAYLLRGHTIFTLTLLGVSLLIFLVTLGCHWTMRKQQLLIDNNGLRDQAPHKRRELLFNTLILSITVYFVSVLGQSFIELAVLWLRDRSQVARLALWYQVAQIAAFADPLLNPILVTLRTPLLQRKLKYYTNYWITILVLICCPWRKHGHKNCHSIKRAVSTTANADSSASQRTTPSEEFTLKLLCTKHIVRSASSRGRNNSAQLHNSVV